MVQKHVEVLEEYCIVQRTVQGTCIVPWTVTVVCSLPGTTGTVLVRLSGSTRHKFCCVLIYRIGTCTVL